MPCVMVNPCVPVATRDVFNALGLRNGELLVGATDILLQDRSWPKAGASIGEWISAFKEVGNDLEAPALRIQPVIGEVLSALSAADGVRLARMSGSGATCFAIFASANEAQSAAEKIRRDHPGWWVHAGTLS
jgi:4-diphosphocytidyl-2-C-methyl-D-erythritol kinase